MSEKNTSGNRTEGQAASQANPSRSQRLSFLALVVLLGTALVVAGLGLASPRDPIEEPQGGRGLGTADTDRGWRLYQHPDLRIAFGYPPEWVMATEYEPIRGSKVIEFNTADADGYFRVVVGPYAASGPEVAFANSREETVNLNGQAWDKSLLWGLARDEPVDDELEGFERAFRNRMIVIGITQRAGTLYRLQLDFKGEAQRNLAIFETILSTFRIFP